MARVASRTARDGPLDLQVSAARHERPLANHPIELWKIQPQRRQRVVLPRDKPAVTGAALALSPARCGSAAGQAEAGSASRRRGRTRNLIELLSRRRTRAGRDRRSRESVRYERGWSCATKLWLGGTRIAAASPTSSTLVAMPATRATRRTRCQRLRSLTENRCLPFTIQRALCRVSRVY